MNTVLSADVEAVARAAALDLLKSPEPAIPLAGTKLHLVKADTPEGEERIAKGWVIATIKEDNTMLLVSTS